MAKTFLASLIAFAMLACLSLMFMAPAHKASAKSAVYSPPVVVAGTPATSAAACTVGQQRLDTTYVYYCVATNTWKRVTLTAF